MAFGDVHFASNVAALSAPMRIAKAAAKTHGAHRRGQCPAAFGRLSPHPTALLTRVAARRKERHGFDLGNPAF